MSSFSRAYPVASFWALVAGWVMFGPVVITWALVAWVWRAWRERGARQ